jgi:hypothetical protein
MATASEARLARCRTPDDYQQHEAILAIHVGNAECRVEELSASIRSGEADDALADDMAVAVRELAERRLELTEFRNAFIALAVREGDWGLPLGWEGIEPTDDRESAA